MPELLQELRDLGLVRELRFTNRETGEVERKSLVLFDGLLYAARKVGLVSISTTLVVPPTKENNWTTIVHASVKTDAGTFSGLGDANKDNVTRKIAPHAPRMAETRAIARALRISVNLRGVICMEELGELPGPRPQGQSRRRSHNGNGIGQRSGGRDHEGEDRRRNSGSNASSDKPMSEPQRRYLFRLLAEDGFEGEQAHQELLRLFGVRDLREISSARASQQLDAWTGKNDQAMTYVRA